MMRCFDISGQERDAAWVMEHYGPIFTQGHSDRYQVAELREAEGNALTVMAKSGVEVKCFFFGYKFGHKGTWGGLVGYPNSEGMVTFPLPVNYTYKIAGGGEHWLNVDGLRLFWLGVPEGALNWKHLDVVLEEKT